MEAVTGLDLPQLDYLSRDLRGPRFYAEMESLRARHWLAASPLGVLVLDREAAELFLRTRSATFPATFGAGAPLQPGREPRRAELEEALAFLAARV